MAHDPASAAAHASRSDARLRTLMGSVSVFTMVMTVPQVLAIWVGHQAAGVSILTWSTYLLSAMYPTTRGRDEDHARGTSLPATPRRASRADRRAILQMDAAADRREVISLKALAADEGLDPAEISRLLPLACLSPDIVEANACRDEENPV